MSNPFEDLAQEQMVRATKRKHERAEKAFGATLNKYKTLADAPMVPTAQEKKQHENSKQFRIWRRYKRAEYRKQLEGPHGEQWRALARALRKLSIDNSELLITHIREAGWLDHLDRNERYVALSIVADAIAKLRVRNGYAPFDDSLPGEEPTAFEIIREMLR